MRSLFYDTLIYGAAAQVYRNHNTDKLVTADVPGLDAYVSVVAPDVKNSTVKPEKSTNENVYFKGAGIKFDVANSLYVKVDIKGGVDAETVKVTANGVDITLETYGNTYIAYTSDIMATALTTETVEFVLTVDGEVVQSFNYSVTAYVAAKWNQTESDGETLTAMASLARALYRYGASAAAYVN